jgi:release factor glutamine methyltransferase
MTIKEALKLGNKKLGKQNKDAEILLSLVLRKNKEFLFTYPERNLTKNQIERYRNFIIRRYKGEPVAYLTGHKEFFGLDFIVNKKVLIPRPETELIVEEALKLTKNKKQPIIIIDVGTGSGCIIISLAKKLISGVLFFGADISKEALSIAKKNAKFNKVDKKIKFICSDLLKSSTSNSWDCNSRVIITANLPYLTPAQIKSSPSIKYEPRLALAAGYDGLKYYKELFGEIKNKFFLDSGSLTLLCEIDPGQTEKIKKLANEFFGGKIKIIKDLSKKDRICLISN